jgi:pimeloyl-ACP methyl ester carboxylesterase
VLALHYCQGTAQAYYTGTKYASLAETYGYFVIYGNSPRSGGCWDVASSQTLSHNGGGDSLGLANAVRYAIANWGVNPSRVFVTGTSSGAMMTSVLAGAYPDLFQAGAVDSGVAFGCFGGPSAWNSQCANGQLIQTPAQWVRGRAVPPASFAGSRRATGQRGPRRVPGLHRCAPEDAGLARHCRHDALPAELLGGDQAMDQRVRFFFPTPRSSPDARVPVPGSTTRRHRSPMSPWQVTRPGIRTQHMGPCYKYCPHYPYR